MSTPFSGLVVFAALSVGACGGAPDGVPSESSNGTDDADVIPAQKLTRAADGSLRRAFIGGAFVTWNSSMPIEIDQAIAGEPTRRQVVVWAGMD